MPKLAHVLTQQDDGRYQCSVCLWSWPRILEGFWKGVPLGTCPGLPRYTYGEQPEHLVTQSEARKRRLKLQPDQPPAACSWWFGKECWTYFYDTRLAEQRPDPTPEQRAATAKARETALRNRTCTRCGEVQTRKLATGICGTCADRQDAGNQAKAQLARTNWVILDTETTGLDYDDEVVQIAVLAPDGRTLYNTLIRPSQPIPVGATAVHGITGEMVTSAPTFPEVYEELAALLRGKRIVAYNADFDARMLHQTCRRYELPVIEAKWRCAMELYAQWVGEWSSYWGNYRWQPLPGGDHSALGDCRATLRLLQWMAGEEEAEGWDTGEFPQSAVQVPEADLTELPLFAG